MKKLTCLILALVLTAVTLSGCRRRAEEAPVMDEDGGPGYTVTDATQAPAAEEANSVPDPLNTPTPQERAAMQVGTSDDIPVEATAPQEDLFAPIDAYEEPVVSDVTMEPTFVPADTTQTSVGAVNPQSYQYITVLDDALDYTLNVPAQWEQIPGIYTVCYREVVDQGDFPARISICRKKLVHTPDDIAMNEQLTSYMKMVAEHYDQATFQTSTPDKEARFMGHKALSNTYLAYWGSIEVKGYVVGVAVDRTLYVLHFCASYADYNAMESVLAYMVQSVALKDDPTKKH